MATASPTIAPVPRPSPKGCSIQNIQNSCPGADLRRQIVSSVTKDPRELPSLLLWNDRGLKLFQELTEQPSYYPTQKEVQILRENVHDIVEQIPENGMVIELGCGSLCKTSVILSAFEDCQRRVSYYALDVSQGELNDGLDQLSPLFRDSQYVQVQGLWGSYEDGIQWLAQTASFASQESRSVTFLWMGNSIANLTLTEASALLRGFVHACAALQLTSQFIVSIDNSTNIPEILSAYDTTRDPFRSFVLNGLKNANNVLGQDVFLLDQWTCTRVFRPERRALDIYYAAREDIECVHGGQSWVIKKGELVHAVSSGKWNIEDMADVCQGAGLKVANAWWLADRSYSFLALCPGV